MEGNSRKNKRRTHAKKLARAKIKCHVKGYSALRYILNFVMLSRQIYTLMADSTAHPRQLAYKTWTLQYFERLKEAQTQPPSFIQPISSIRRVEHEKYRKARRDRRAKDFWEQKNRGTKMKNMTFWDRVANSTSLLFFFSSNFLSLMSGLKT